MKKLLACLVAFVMCLSIVTFAGEAQNSDVEINVAALNGPTGMGIAYLNKQSDEGNTEYKYNISYASAPDEITGGIISGEIQIASVPINLASVLFNKTEGAVQIMAVNTLGVLYILEKNPENAEAAAEAGIAYLEGKTVMASGQGSTPEYILQYLLEANGIADKVEVEYAAEHDEAVTAMASDKASIIMVPEPKVTAAKMQIEGVETIIDVNAAWEAATGVPIVQGVIVVQKAFAEEHPEIVGSFLNEYEVSAQYVNENIEDASAIIESYGIIPKAAIAKAAIPNCNIVCITGEEMQTSVDAMLQVLYEANPKSVGGNLPGSELYYTQK